MSHWRRLAVAVAVLVSRAVAITASPPPRSSPSSPIAGVSRMEPFGRARYDDNLPLVTWRDLNSRETRLGAICDPDRHSSTQCGSTLVCRQGVCRHCLQNRECPSLHRCVKSDWGDGGNECRPLGKLAWEQAFSDFHEALCSLLVFAASVLAAAAGTGGGGVFVPLLLMFSHIKVEAAVPLSQCMVFCGSIVNLIFFVGQRHPESPDLPKIDYNCVVLFEPMLVLGVTLGVLVHQTAPKWLIVVLLLLTLSLALWRTSLKGIKQFRQEAALPLQADADLEAPPGSCLGAVAEGWRTAVHLVRGHLWQVLGICSVWMLMLISSAHGLSICSRRYVLYLSFLTLCLCALTYLFERRLATEGAEASLEAIGQQAAKAAPSLLKPKDDDVIGRARLPGVAFGAGLLGGLLGLGGGVIVGPVLLEIGMHSEVVQATTAAFVFVSSSLATLQFALLSQHIWHYALWYGALVGTATLLGQYLCTEVVQKRKRYSAITLSIAGVLAASLVALTIVGAAEVYDEFTSGRQVWFSASRLCNGNGIGIVTVDVAPAQPWPSDLPRLPPTYPL